MFTRFWFWLLQFSLRRRARSWKACANRVEIHSRFGATEVTVTFRDTTQPDGYSREELVEMLALVRHHERLQGWKVPE